MTRQEYLKKLNNNEQVPFIIASPTGNMTERTWTYKQTPQRTVWEWLEADNNEKYIVLNDSHPPIDITGAWVSQYERGHLKCALITTTERLIEYYGEKQGNELIKYYSEK